MCGRSSNSHISPYVSNVGSCGGKKPGHFIRFFPSDLKMDVVLAGGQWT